MRPDDKQWLDVLSQCSSWLGMLESSSGEARARAQGVVRVGNDGYPASSMPESSIAAGRGGDPTGEAVVRAAGGKLEDADNGTPATPDTWERRQADEVGRAVRQMEHEVSDAWARLAGATDAVDQALGLGRAVDPKAPSDWSELLFVCRGYLTFLGRRSLELRGLLDGQSKMLAKRMEREVADALNRLRTAAGAMNNALPKRLPDPAREVCKSCKTSKDVVTYFGQKPYEWIVSMASCRACAKRQEATKPAAKGKRAS